MLTFQAVTLMAVGVINVIFALVVLQSAAKSRTNRLFFLFSVSVAVWSWGIALFLKTDSLDLAQTYVNFYYVSAVSVVCFLVGFILSIIKPKIHSIWLILGAAPIIAMAAALSLNKRAMVEVVNISTDLTERVIVHGIPYGAYAFGVALTGLIGCSAYVLYALSIRARIRRTQQLIVATSMAIAMLFGLFFNLYLPQIGNYDWIAWGPFFTLIFNIATVYAIARYSYLDQKRTFVHSLSYIATFASVMGGATFLFSLASDVFTRDSEANRTIIYVGLMITSAFLLNWLRDKFDAISVRLFLSDKYNLNETVEKFGKSMAFLTDVRQVIDRGQRTLKQALKVDFIATVLMTDKGRIDHIRSSKLGKLDIRQVESMVEGLTSTMIKNGSVVAHDVDEKRQVWLAEQLKLTGTEMIVEMHDQSVPFGYIVIGSKKGRANLIDTDIQLVNMITSELALAIRNGLKFEQIESFNKQLGETVDEATDKLRQSNNELRRRDAVKDEFVSMASHQLRTPLTAVRGYLSMVLDGDAGKLTKQQRELLNEASRSSAQMAGLVRDFLTVSRIQTGKFLLEKAPHDLAELVTEEVDALKMFAEKQNIELTYRKPRHSMVLPVDVDKLRQVIINFIDNAICYSLPGTTASVELFYDSGEVVFEVRDSGIGVPKEAQDQLFKRFYRATNARTRRPDGTGIGLFLAKKVIDEHGGRVIFSSKQNEGSRFGFRLPIAKLTSPKSNG